jgi:hypothetical protein
MNTDENIHNKKLAKWIWQHIKKTIHHDQAGFNSCKSINVKQHTFPLESGTKQGFEVLARAIRQEKEIKGIQIGKEEVKVSFQMYNPKFKRS